MTSPDLNRGRDGCVVMYFSSLSNEAIPSAYYCKVCNVLRCVCVIIMLLQETDREDKRLNVCACACLREHE